MTRLETFRIVRDHLLNQNKRSVIGVICQYRGPDGTKCAAGCLIRDDQYLPEMEGLYCNCEMIGKIIRDNGHDPDFVHRLQSIHDEIPVDVWPYVLQKIEDELNVLA